MADNYRRSVWQIVCAMSLGVALAACSADAQDCSNDPSCSDQLACTASDCADTETGRDTDGDTFTCPSERPLQCQGSCVDPETNPEACGSCGQTCANGELCERGRCVADVDCEQSGCTGFTWCNSTTGRCESGCDADEQCGPNQTCLSDTHQCICGDGYRECDENCVECPDGANVIQFGCSEGRCVATECAEGFETCPGGCCENGARPPDGSVDTDGDVGWGSVLALDPDDDPHIVYVDVTEVELKYAEWRGDQWLVTTLDSQRRVTGKPSLHIDEEGTAHVSYYDEEDRALRYGVETTGGFQSTVVDSSDNVGRMSSLAVDSAMRPHIAYFDQANDDVKYARWDGAQWHVETAVASGAVGRELSLAIDSSDRPHIAYYDEDNNDLRYVTWTSQQWQSETVVASQNAGTDLFLTLDEDDNPHLSYRIGTTSNDKLGYSRRNGSNWHNEIVDEPGGNFSCVKLDGQGEPRITYSSGDGGLGYARWSGDSWTLEHPDTRWHVGWSTSFAIDNDGGAHISHYDWKDGNLEYLYIP